MVPSFVSSPISRFGTRAASGPNPGSNQAATRARDAGTAGHPDPLAAIWWGRGGSDGCVTVEVLSLKEKYDKYL